MTINGEPDFSSMSIHPIPEDAKSGNLQVTVGGLTSNTWPIKVGVEDWLANKQTIDPFVGIKIIFRDAVSGETKWHNDFLHNYILANMPEVDLVWSGTSFTLTADPTGNNPWKIRVSGSINENGTIINSMKYVKEYYVSEDWHIKWEFDVVNIPLSWATPDDFVNYEKVAPSSEIQSYITKLEYTEHDHRGSQKHDWSVDSFEYKENEMISVRFRVRQ
jgi:hypothetical protein